MIKYVELTAPEASAFRQAKIVSIECQEGDRIAEGDTLFIVKSGDKNIPLPATSDGTVAELIATVDTNITLSTPLLLLETEVPKSTASKGLDEMVDARDQPLSEKVDSNLVTAQSNQPSAKTQIASGTDGGREEVILTLEAQPMETPEAELKALSKKQKSAETEKKPVSRKRPDRQQNLDLLIDYHIETSKVEQGETSKVINENAQSPNAAKTQEESQSPQTQHTRKTDATPNQPQPETSSMASDSKIEIRVPDIGADSAKVIEILVQEGDTIAAEDSIVTLESDKASMDVPAPQAGTVVSIEVNIDDEVNEGTLLLTLSGDASTEPQENASQSEVEEKSVDASTNETQTPSAANESKESSESSSDSKSISSKVSVSVPDIGGDSAKVIEILVAVGDEVAQDDSIITLESDKASMDVPSSEAGIVESIEVSIDDDLSEGDVILTLKAQGQAKSDESNAQVPSRSQQSESASPSAPSSTTTSTVPATKGNSASTNTASSSSSGQTAGASKSHASPSVRRFARELGVDLGQVKGTGRKQRVLKDDVKAYVKGEMTNKQSSTPAQGSGIPEVPAQDFSKFGEIEVQALNKIKRLTASNLHRSWLNLPHVTHNDEANISDLESFRKQINADFKKNGEDIKLSPLAFIVKAVVRALRKYPQFNSSLEPGGENLILKKYFHIGIAVDTPNGLVVPVVRDADKKSVSEIAAEMSELAAKARDKKLTMNDMSGACFTISSLGGIGGTGFTPIVNAPEVAILGVSRSKIQPVWNGEEFEPGLMLPLSLSYDHRVIDGAEAARFARHVAEVLEDVRLLTI